MSVGTSAAGAPCAASSLAARVWSTRPKALKRKIRARAARPIHCPYRMSRSPPSGGDQMRDDGRRVSDVEPSKLPIFRVEVERLVARHLAPVRVRKMAIGHEYRDVAER